MVNGFESLVDGLEALINDVEALIESLKPLIEVLNKLLVHRNSGAVGWRLGRAADFVNETLGSKESLIGERKKRFPG